MGVTGVAWATLIAQGISLQEQRIFLPYKKSHAAMGFFLHLTYFMITSGRQ